MALGERPVIWELITRLARTSTVLTENGPEVVSWAIDRLRRLFEE